jgi:DNA-binding FadR family transcriptional regulator
MIREVVDRDYAVGEKLPRVADLAERNEISRGSMLATLQTLEGLGLVEVKHGVGPLVRPEADWDLLDPVVLHAIVTADDRLDLLAELIECRRIVEPPAAALAAERAGGADLERLANALRAMEDAAGGKSRGGAEEHPFVRAEAAFHRTLVELAGNRPLARMLLPLHTGLAVARHERAPTRQALVLERHAQIHAAVAAHDPDAARQALLASVDELGGWILKRRRR